MPYTFPDRDISATGSDNRNPYPESGQSPSEVAENTQGSDLFPNGKSKSESYTASNGQGIEQVVSLGLCGMAFMGLPLALAVVHGSWSSSSSAETNILAQRVNEINNLIEVNCAVEGENRSLAEKVQDVCEQKLTDKFRAMLDFEGGDFIVSDRDSFGREIDMESDPDGETNYNNIRERLNTIVPELVQKTYDDAEDVLANQQIVKQANEVLSTALNRATDNIIYNDQYIFRSAETVDVDVKSLQNVQKVDGTEELAISFKSVVADHSYHGSDFSRTMVYDHVTQTGGSSAQPAQETVGFSADGTTSGKAAGSFSTMFGQRSMNLNMYGVASFSGTIEVPDSMVYEDCAEKGRIACAFADQVHKELNDLSKQDQEVLASSEKAYQEVKSYGPLDGSVPLQTLSGFQILK